MNKFTPSQLKAINTRGNNILVSAGAGSGKTTVLTNRVAEYVKSGGDIRRLLIITFTNLAARNMKDKIKEKLALLNEEQDLSRIDSSFIGTFDSYTFYIVKKYHYALGLSKNINITDYSFVLKKKREFVDEIFDQHYISKDAEFLELVSNTCVKSDHGLRDVVINIDNSFENLVSRKERCQNYMDTTFSSDNIDKNLSSFVDMLKVKLIPVGKALFTLNDTLTYEKNIRMLQTEIADFQAIETYDDLYSFVNTTYISRLMKESSDAKEANNTLKSMIKELKDMAKYEKISDFKDEILKTLETNKVIISLVEELNEKIVKYKADNNIFTFNDISILAIKLLTDFPEIKAEIKNSYDEILIDEYQDTSDIEEKLISLIAQNNVYMVGDIKQSIYRFRNANPDIFIEKYDNYLHTSAGTLINLQANFRSRPEVIADINNIFCDLMHSNTGGADYKEHHQMTYGNKSYDTCKMNDYDYHMDIYNYYDLYEELKQRYKKGEIEAQIIAKDISEKIRSKFLVKGHNGQRAAKYSDFCIIMDRTVDYEIYKKIFSSLGIPLSVSEGQKIRNCEEIVPFIRLLELINAIHNHDTTSRQFSYKFTSVARSYICNYSDEKIFDLIKNKTIIDDPLYKMAENIAKETDDLLLSEVTKRVIDDFKIYDKFITIGSVDKSLAVFNFLLSFSNSFDQLKYDISDYIDFLNDAMSGDLKLEFALDDNSGGVRLIDIHKSKGLEFKVCYFAGIDKRFNNPTLRQKFNFDKDLGLIVPYFENGPKDTCYKDLFLYKNNLEEKSEKIRLFYVALTRSIEKIIIIDRIQEDKFRDPSLYELINFNSFHGLMNLCYSKFKKRIRDITDIEVSKVYDNDVSLICSGKKIDVTELKTHSSVDNEVTRYSKNTKSLIDKVSREKMDYGTYIHYVLECLDFKNPKFNELRLKPELKAKLETFLNSELLKNVNQATIYKEYEFIEGDRTGIIDLMLKYPDHIDIIDYKLKNIDDEAYIVQLQGYQNYVKSLTQNVVHTYLYSLIDGVFRQIT